MQYLFEFLRRAEYMNGEQLFFKSVKMIYERIFPPPLSDHPINRVLDPHVVNGLIYKQLMSAKPCMIARIGAFELATMINYLGVLQGRPVIKEYLKGNALDWWWNKKLLEHMQFNAGFFPPTPKNITRFCELMICESANVDILGSWLANERFFEKELRHSIRVGREPLNPYFSKNPWTKALENKKVLVVHPFAYSIESQYKKRELLFENKDILPAFELKTIKAVQSIKGEQTAFTDWFEALEYMKTQIDKIDFDVCLIGCGAYGFPLAAHVKRAGKKAVHLGGSLQLLFGIKGKRWETPDYNSQYNYAALMNEHWVRPCEEEKPKNAHKVENACYW